MKACIGAVDELLRLTGRIDVLSSVLGFMPAPYQGFYALPGLLRRLETCARRYSETLDLEARPFGVRVVVIEPSSIHSSFFEHREEAKVRHEFPPVAREADSSYVSSNVGYCVHWPRDCARKPAGRRRRRSRRPRR